MGEVAGFTAAVLSAVFNGSFAAFAKLHAVRASGVDPVIFNAYCCAGVAFSSWAAIPFLPHVGIDGWGILAGSLFVLAVLFSFLAIPLAGLSVAQGVWGGTAILVAFLWGAVGPSALRAPLASPALSSVAIVLLVLGVLGIVNNAAIAATIFPVRGPVFVGLVAGSHSPPAPADALRGPDVPEVDSPEAVSDDGARKEAAPFHRWLAGIVCALAVGVFGGSVLAPAAFLPADLAGFGLLPSFGTGAAGAGLVVTALAVGVKQSLGVDVVLGGTSPVLPGLASGLVWNLGNIASIYAISYAGLNYGIAYPILQCALFVSGLIGIFVFQEITRPQAIGVFFGASAVLISGAVLLGIFGPSSAVADDFE